MQNTSSANFGRLLSPVGTFLLGLVLVLPAAPAAAKSRTGEQIYRQQCAACHGKEGEGTLDNYPRQLAGKRSVVQLAKLIARTMPQDADEKCSPADARLVAAYIYEAFYSPAAQA